jgi:hypothetical protein
MAKTPKTKSGSKTKSPKKKSRKTNGRGARAVVTMSAPLAAPLLVSSSHPALTDAARAAVIGCVNSFMDAHRLGWNADLHGDGRKMGSDYHFPPPAIPLVLKTIRDCLQNKHFTFTISNELIQTCAAGTLAGMKFAIYQATKTT